MIKRFNEFIFESSNIGKMTVEDILNDPTKQYVSEKICISTINDILSQIEIPMFDDDSLQKIIIFFGINFSQYADIINEYFF